MHRCAAPDGFRSPLSHLRNALREQPSNTSRVGSGIPALCRNSRSIACALAPPGRCRRVICVTAKSISRRRPDVANVLRFPGLAEVSVAFIAHKVAQIQQPCIRTPCWQKGLGCFRLDILNSRNRTPIRAPPCRCPSRWRSRSPACASGPRAGRDWPPHLRLRSGGEGAGTAGYFSLYVGSGARRIGKQSNRQQQTRREQVVRHDSPAARQWCQLDS